MYEACVQDKIASASIKTYDVMVACTNSKEKAQRVYDEN